jgi:hypothetical protein
LPDDSDDEEVTEGPRVPQSSSSMSSVEEETQVVHVSPARTNASGAVVQRGQADAAAAAGKKRAAAGESLGGRASMPGDGNAGEPSAAKKTRVSAIVPILSVHGSEVDADFFYLRPTDQ